MFDMSTLTSKEVYNLTEFVDIFELLSYAIISCGSDIDLLTKKIIQYHG